MSLKLNKISREEFFKLKEEDLMFITNPGRMGDEDGSTFIIKSDDDYICYRIDGWMYGNRNDIDFISFNEMRKQFPKWSEALKNNFNKDFHGKYTFIYMGFGNGLCVDNSIYDIYKTYLLEEVKKEREQSSFQDESPSFYYPSWIPAYEKMINDLKNVKR